MFPDVGDIAVIQQWLALLLMVASILLFSFDVHGRTLDYGGYWRRRRMRASLLNGCVLTYRPPTYQFRR